MINSHPSGYRRNALGVRFSASASAILVVFVSLAFGGCSHFKLDNEDSQSGLFGKAEENGDSQVDERSRTNDKSQSNAVATKKQNVRLEGALQLGNTDNLIYTPAELAEAFNELLEAKKLNSARSLVLRYPDITTQILVNARGDSLSWTRLARIAKFYDTQWSIDGQSLWQDFVQAAARNGQSNKLAIAQAEFRQHLKQNQPELAMNLRLDRSLGRNENAIIVAEVYRLEAIARLALGLDQESIKFLEKSMKVLKESQPYQASQLGLLLGEAYRHSGATKQWESSWQSAIETHSIWLVERELNDPTFWKKAAFLRPVSTPWPSNVIARLKKAFDEDNIRFHSESKTDNEALVWALIGKQSLTRHESQNAILAFKKSEALVASPAAKKELQLKQAIAMIDGGQPGPASAILLRLSSKTDVLGDRSKAILATLKLQNGSLAQGMNLLQSAIATSRQWPTDERLRAQADYGLAYLMLGREKKGIDLLNRIHKEFLQNNEFEQAARCLENISAYYNATEQASQQKAINKRLDDLESL